LADFWPTKRQFPRSGADCKSAGFTPSVVRIHSCPMLYLSCSSAKIADSRAIQLQESMSNRIEGAVGEAEGLCVANFEFHGKPMISAPPDCLGDQQFAEVHAGDKAVGADRGGEFEGVGACREKRRSATLKSPVSNTSEMFFSSTNTKRAPGFGFLAQARISGERSRPVVAEFGNAKRKRCSHEPSPQPISHKLHESQTPCLFRNGASRGKSSCACSGSRFTSRSRKS